jgi:hypothetical protein
MPALSAGFGYWASVTSDGAGTVSATWTSPPKSGRLAIYAGNPFSGRPDPVKLAPPSGALRSVAVSGRNVSLTTAVVPAGTYTAYFYAKSAIGARQGTVTVMRTSCGP